MNGSRAHLDADGIQRCKEARSIEIRGKCDAGTISLTRIAGMLMFIFGRSLVFIFDLNSSKSIGDQCRGESSSRIKFIASERKGKVHGLCCGGFIKWTAR